MTSVPKRYPMPFTRLEIVVLSVLDHKLQVLLARRAEAPHAGKWALPGGALRIEMDTSLDAAARRVANERLGVEVPYLRQLRAVGGPTRDPRAPWALSVVYRAMVPAERVVFSAGKRVEALAWRPVESVIADKGLAFDHPMLVFDAVERTRGEVERLELPAGLLEGEFTLGELQTTCEHLLGRRLDKSSFRRKLGERQIVESVEGRLRAGRNRPAQLFRLQKPTADGAPS